MASTSHAPRSLQRLLRRVLGTCKGECLPRGSTCMQDVDWVDHRELSSLWLLIFGPKPHSLQVVENQGPSPREPPGLRPMMHPTPSGPLLLRSSGP